MFDIKIFREEQPFRELCYNQCLKYVGKQCVSSEGIISNVHNGYIFTNTTNVHAYNLRDSENNFHIPNLEQSLGKGAYSIEDLFRGIESLSCPGTDDSVEIGTLCPIECYTYQDLILLVVELELNLRTAFV